jgi:hypothetical protein
VRVFACLVIPGLTVARVSAFLWLGLRIALLLIGVSRRGRLAATPEYGERQNRNRKKYAHMSRTESGSAQSHRKSSSARQIIVLLMLRRFVLLAMAASSLSAQVYSPKLLGEGQPDSTNLAAFTQTMYRTAGAHTDRERAEAIWRFFLTDGRFVAPGFWYHIAGWTYEEPSGEVLDPIKLLNSYGFGLCYHVAPLLEAVFKAGGFTDARCWFLTGHTVAEVFYDGAYHYFDSDLMGYNTPGIGSFRGKSVSSVHDIERDPQIILGKLAGPKSVIPGTVDSPWYPADLRAGAIGELAALFSTTDDNRLYPYPRYASGHNMAFVLRRGESLTRFFQPEEPGLFYLPYVWDGRSWREFPQESDEFHIRTADGPRSQKDSRMWATGRIDYTPPECADLVETIEMPSPYVIIDARFSMRADIEAGSSVRIETSVDRGLHWDVAAERKGPFHGDWNVQPKEFAKSQHGHLTAVSGSYGYLFRLTRSDVNSHVKQLHLTSRIELNPRSLPAVRVGQNHFHFSSGEAIERVNIPAPLQSAPLHDLKIADEQGQRLLYPAGKSGYVLYKLETNTGALTGFDVGARFLDMPDGIAPNKLTAETRQSTIRTTNGPASLAWSLNPNGPFQELWHYSRAIEWRDRQPIDRLLRWPEVFREVRDLPPGTQCVYVKFATAGPALDSIRLALYRTAALSAGTVELEQVWTERGTQRQHLETFPARARQHDFDFTAGPDIRNEAVTIRCR